MLVALLAFMGSQPLFVREPVPSAPYTAEASYGRAEWSGDSLVINYVQSTWQTFQRLDVQSTPGSTHIRVLLTQVDHLSIGDPTLVWRSQKLNVLVPPDAVLYVGDVLVSRSESTRS